MTMRLVDTFGRLHNYLRISVTDRCNLRCAYCMKPEGVKWIARREILSYEAMVKIVKVAAELGVTKVRLTGGEPLTRPDLAGLVHELRRIPGLQEIALTTNGILLSEQARILRDAGLDRVNVSLDSLDSQIYNRITRGGDLKAVLRGIDTALAVELQPLKINVVFLRGINDCQFGDFMELARQNPLEVRFIEYMPVGTDNPYHPEYFGSLADFPGINALIAGGVLQKVADSEDGNAERYSISGGEGSIALIRPISHHFCSACNRLRLTADGFLKSCLYWPDELNVKMFLNNPDGLRDQFFKAVAGKHKEHHMEPNGKSSGKRCMSGIGG
jgi:cyclic pyranopterin phosphate synthase